LTVDGLRLTVLGIGLSAVTACSKGVDDPTFDLTGPAIAVVTVTPATASLKSGTTQQFTVSFQPALSDSRVVWTVTDTITARIDANGLLTALSPGKTTVTATSYLNLNTKGSAQVTVTP
jgi:uncharacterized protein YjdB